MRFTPNQERALAMDRHIAVTANAGSGKTRVLVERYVRLLERGVPVGEVVALTYTEKAASALRRKIAERVSGSLLEAREPDRVARLESIRDALPAAFIGTIHAFCSRILREYPVEAGIDASFTMIESVDSRIMLRECMSAVLGEVLRGENEGIPAERLMELLRSFGRRRVVSLIERFAAKGDLLERLAGPGGIYARTDDRVLEEWDSVLRRAIDEALCSPSLLEAFDAIVNASNSKRTAEARDALARLRSGPGGREREQAYAALVSMMFTKAGGIQKRFLAGDDLPLAGHVQRITGTRRLLDPLVDADLAAGFAPLNRPLLGDTRILLSLAGAVVGRYALRKEEDARLDFDDLQLKMRRLLGDPTIREELAGRFRFVMVDEYQDTNTLQLEILLPLLDDLAAGNLLIVGDPKQSIYRFRDADVAVFDRSRRAIAGAAGDDSLVGLGESFRPLRDPVAFVNLLFGGIMNAHGGTPYDPLVRARKNDDPGAVELLIPLPPEEGGITQEDLVARRILDLVSGSPGVFTVAEEPRPLLYRDIALLLRSRNGLEAFEQAFIRNGVPYVVSGGVGYFQTQDVYDMYNYLRFLLNTSDDVALAGILRAPFFSVSDAELFDAARSRGGKTLWEALAGPAPRRVPSIAHAREVIAEDLLLGMRLPAAELIARIIARTGFIAALSGTVRGEQAGANLGKLLEMARSYESQGFASLYDFVGRLERLIEEEEKEGQAAIESQTDTVRVMTVHAAKGLEFPVVIVPDLQRQFRYDEEPYVDPAIGIGLDPGSGAVAAPLAEYLEEKGRRKAVAEEERIFYVACTRARDRILLSSDPPGRRTLDSWLGWIERCCADNGRTLLTGPLTFEVTTDFFDGEGTKPESHTLVVPVIRDIPARAAQASPLSAAEGESPVDIAPVLSRSKGEIYSASRIRTYVECPAKYFFRYVLGVPSGGGPFVPETDAEFADGDYPAELRGRVFHSALENAGALRGGEAAVETAVRQALSREAPLTEEAYPSLVGDVALLVGGVLASRSWQEIEAGSEVRTEFSISAALGGDFITGTIDRLYRAGDGIWTVLDYKTDGIGESEVTARAGLYWPQLEFYALMVQRLCAADSVRVRLLFAHHPEIRLERILGHDDLLRQEEHVARIISNIKSGRFPPSETPCHGCPMHPRPCTPG